MDTIEDISHEINELFDQLDPGDQEDLREEVRDALTTINKIGTILEETS